MANVMRVQRHFSNPHSLFNQELGDLARRVVREREVQCGVPQLVLVVRVGTPVCAATRNHNEEHARGSLVTEQGETEEGRRAGTRGGSDEGVGGGRWGRGRRMGQRWGSGCCHPPSSISHSFLLIWKRRHATTQE
jgi:hypothetical protein